MPDPEDVIANVDLPAPEPEAGAAVPTATPPPTTPGLNKAALNSAAWTIRALGLWLASALIAWPIAAFYGNSQLVQLIPVLGLATAVSGFNATSMLTLSRHLAQARLVVLEVGTYVFSQAVVIVWVAHVPTVWALVVGNLIGSVLVMVGSHAFLPGMRNRPQWDRSAVRDILHFGR